MTENTTNDENFGPWILIGLDGEMSSADIETGGKLIQAGAAAWKAEPGGELNIFSSLIAQDEMEWSERAAQVHNLTREEIAAGPTPAEVDEALYAWLLENGATEGKRMVVPIGFNVASFDMPFFRQSLPKASSLIARRAVDLNAMCFTFAGWDPNPTTEGARDFAGWKRSLKKEANTLLRRSGFAVAEHDASFDAAQALVGLMWLKGEMSRPVDLLGAAETQLDGLDPLRKILGKGLLGRLENIDRADLEAIVTAFPDDVNIRRWFGVQNDELGCTPLEALTEGRTADVFRATPLGIDLNIDVREDES